MSARAGQIDDGDVRGAGRHLPVPYSLAEYGAESVEYSYVAVSSVPGKLAVNHADFRADLLRLPEKGGQAAGREQLIDFWQAKADLENRSAKFLSGDFYSFRSENR